MDQRYAVGAVIGIVALLVFMASPLWFFGLAAILAVGWLLERVARGSSPRA